MSGDSTNTYGKKTRLVEFFNQAIAAITNSPGTAAPEAFDELLIFIDVTVAGTSITISYQLSDDDGTTWWTRGTPSTITAVGQTLVALPDGIGRFCRLRADAVTGSFTLTARIEFKRNGEG